jgi:uncharacterized membrane protein YfcA
MFPVAIVVSTIAMASGVGGATFFAPILILGLRLPAEVAIGTGLMTEVFGFASGLTAYIRRKLIDFKLGWGLLIVAVPAAVLGAWLANRVPPEILKTILGMGLVALALSFLRAPDHQDVERLDDAIEDDHKGDVPGMTSLTTAEGEVIRYTVCNRTEGRTLAAIGALFMGMISSGLGEINGFFLLQRCRVPSRVAVATSVFVVAVTALSAAVGHLIQFMDSGPEVMSTVLSIVMFTIPGVVLGGQIGPVLGSHISQKVLERGLGVIFLIVGGIMIGAQILG